MGQENNYSTWVEIELSAIEDNVRYVRELSGVQVMATVKANAYGHGVLPVARAALQGGATWCGVARIEEALELRDAGVECPILVLGYIPAGRLPDAIKQGISMTVWGHEQVKMVSELGEKGGIPAHMHLKVDTGMGRLGCPPETAVPLAEYISESPGILLEGIFTHFARADELDTSTSDHQEEIFRTTIFELQGRGLRPPLVHAANSAASLTRPSAHFDLVRLGIAMYGLHPSHERPAPARFRPALTWKSLLSQVKVLPAGSGVSYGHEYITQKDERVGTIPVGYADGFRRTSGNYVLVAGQRVPVIGRVCMDQIMVQLDDVPGAKAGDTVTLLGQQGDSRISAEDIAKAWHTINHEVVCGIGARVPRILV